MAFDDDIRDTFTGLFGLGAIGAGFGYSIYKGSQDFGGLGALYKSASGTAGGTLSPFIPSSTKATMRGSLAMLEEAQRSGFAVMGEEGWRTAVKKAVKMSALGSGKIGISQIAELMNEIDEASPDRLLGVIQAKEGKVGGLGSVYQNLEGLLGSRLRGNRGKSLDELILGLGDRGYSMSSFGSQGSFWREHLKFMEPEKVEGLTTTRLSKMAIPSGARSPAKHAQELQAALKSMGIEAQVAPGIRDITPDPTSGRRRFLPGMGAETVRSVSASDKLRLPFAELQIKIPGQSTAYVPINYARQGFVASGMGKMSTAAVRSFTVPVPGGGRQLVNWNEALSMMMYGEGGQVGSNLATIIHDSVSEGSSLRQATERFNQLVRSQVREITTLPHVKAGSFGGTGITSSAGARIIAATHQASYVPLEDFMVRGLKPGGTYTTPELTKIMEAAEASGIGAYPMSSPSSIARSAAFSQIGFHERWDIFGSEFPYERRFLQGIRDFEPTQAAREAMSKSRIYGRLSRNIPVTATPDYIKEVVGSGYSAPNVVMAYALKDSQSLRPEEILISKGMSDMMETQTYRTHWLTGEFGSVATGTALESGQLIGVDAKTGKPIYSKAKQGMMGETVVGSETQGGVTKLTVQRQFPLQQQTKIFGIKATLRPTGEAAMRQAAQQEWGVPLGARWGMPTAEAYGSADLLKKNPAMIRRQMLEATLTLGAKRMAALEAKGLEAPESMQKALGKGGRRYLRNLLTKTTGKFGTEEKILALAKGWQFTPEEMGWVAGHWLEVEEKKITSLKGGALTTAQQELDAVFKVSGITEAERGMVREARFVLGTPTFYSGDYPLLNQWERGSVDPRGIKEILLHDWTTEKGERAGKLIAEELERRRIPAQNLDEMERILLSMSGEGPGGLKTYTPQEALAKLKLSEGGFVMQMPRSTEAFTGRNVYVPSEARLMGFFTNEVGEELPQTLLGDYMKLANASIAQQAGEEGAEASLDLAARGIRDSAYKQWLMSTQARGQIAGTTAPVMQSWLAQSQHFDTVEDFVSSTRPMTVGVGRETVRESFEDLVRLASSSGERDIIKKQMQQVLETGEGVGLAWRHPMIFPFSTMPVKYKITEQSTHGIHFPTVTIGNKKVDVSGMLAMAADTDFDRANFAVIADEKVNSAVDGLINDSRYRRQYAQVMEMQYDLESLAKQNIGVISPDYNKVEGLKRLASMQIATPEVSVAAQKLKAALAHAQSPEQATVLSSLITQLEQRAIQAKKGGEAEVISKAIRNTVGGFIAGEGSLAQTKDEFNRAWTAIWGQESFTAGETQFEVNDMYNQLSGLMDVAKAGEHVKYNERIVRRAARANRGGSVAAGSMQEIMDDIKAYRAGLGDPASHLVRAMREGPGSGAEMLGGIPKGVTSRLGMVKEAMKKNWKYPAIGIGAAIGARYLFGSNDLDMPEPQHDQKATEQIMNMPREAPPAPDSFGPPAIQTMGAPQMGPAMSTSFNAPSGGYSIQGTQAMMGFVGNLGQGNQGGLMNVILRDERGSISPEYIRKQMEERYY